jgi:hypothetical protein
MSTRWLPLLMLACGIPATAADREFDAVVKAIEAHYGAQHTHIPLMGVANLFVKVARPAGTSSVHLAVFDHLDAAGGERDDFMDHVDKGKLHPLVRAHARNGEATYILAGDPGKTTRLLIATFSRDAATVIEVKVNEAALRRTIDHPGRMAKSLLGEREDR